MYRRKDYKDKRKDKDAEDMFINKPQIDSGTPDPKDRESINKDSGYFQARAFKDLRFGPITVAANPNVEGTKASQPYAIIASANRVADASYPGTRCLAGNTIQQLLNSTNSKLQNCFDSGNMKLRLHYLYLAIDPTDKNKALNLQMGSAISEALSFGYSEMLTQLPFYTDVVTTTMPTTDADNKGAVLTWYQSMLLNTAAIPAKYLETRSLETEVTDMGFNKEAPIIHDLYGLLKKAAFISVINGISKYTQGEYFDNYWFKQMNVLCNVPSRKSKSMTDPLLTIRGVHALPSVSLTRQGASSPIFDSSTYVATVNGVSYTAETLAAAILDDLDVHSIIKWARDRYYGNSTVTPQQYFNNIVDLLEAYKLMMTHFAADMSDVRTFLDRMNSAGLNSWSKGWFFDIPVKVPQHVVTFNVLCHNVFAAFSASADAMTYDSDTYRWKYYTMWNKFTGVPAYDLYDGGSFLTFSVRTLPSDTDYTTTKWLIPKLFDVAANSVNFVARTGFNVDIGYTVYNNATINSDNILSRLNPLSLPGLTMRIPQGSVLSAGNIPSAASALYCLINTIYGFGQIEVSTGVYDTCLSADNVCFVDIEMDDISNAMINFSRAFSPFRVANNDSSISIGFLNTRSKPLA